MENPRYVKDEVYYTALDLLQGAIQYIQGRRETKPKTNNLDAAEMVADALSEAGIK